MFNKEVESWKIQWGHTSSVVQVWSILLFTVETQEWLKKIIHIEVDIMPSKSNDKNHLIEVWLLTYLGIIKTKATRIIYLSCALNRLHSWASLSNPIIAWVSRIEPLRPFFIIRPTSGTLIVSLFQIGFLFHLDIFYKNFTLEWK